MAAQTPLYDVHTKLGARFTEFHGFDMPVEYTGIGDEHQAVRTGVGMFDVSHMGELEVRGPQAIAFLDWLLPNDIMRLEPGHALYTPMCNEAGGIMDDLVVYALGANRYWLVVNCGNVEQDLQWIRARANDSDLDVEIDNLSAQVGLLALQGPRAASVLQPVVNESLQALNRFQSVETEAAGMRVRVSRTGYTGEDGFELFVSSDEVTALWQLLMDQADGQPTPVGLGARDTLRLEVCYPLHGQDITQDTTPVESGLSWTVAWDKPAFIGRDCLIDQRAKEPARRLMAFEMEERGIPRTGCPVHDESGVVIGRVTSGTYSPFLEKSIGLAYLPPRAVKIGSPIHVEIRERALAARVVRKPFYRSESLAATSTA